MKLYPLVFSFRDIIAGNGFVASVSMDGRVLLAEEDDQDIWMFGVQPGGIAGGDRERSAAFREFKQSYLSVLFDIAKDAASFEEFERQTKDFFEQVNAPNAAQWAEALEHVRKKNVSLSDLKTVKAEASPPHVSIERVAPEKSKPNINEFDQIAEAA